MVVFCMQIYNNKILSYGVNVEKNTSKNSGSAAGVNADKTNSVDFKNVLCGEIDKNSKNSAVQFSKHAAMRLDNRNLSLTSEQMKRVEDGVDKASRKGINDSLILVDDIALVVNVRNKIVITAMNKDIKSDNTFTNIDGAVIV